MHREREKPGHGLRRGQEPSEPHKLVPSTGECNSSVSEARRWVLRAELGDEDGAGTGESFADCFGFQCNGPGQCPVNRSTTWSSLFHRVAMGT